MAKVYTIANRIFLFLQPQLLRLSGKIRSLILEEVKVSRESKVTTAEIEIPASSNLIARSLNFIDIEIRCELLEVVDPVALSDLGTDSLMSLSIVERFREGFELNFASILQWLTHNRESQIMSLKMQEIY